MGYEDYKSETVVCDYLSDPTADECESLIGKTVAKVEAREHVFKLIFADGSTVEVSGARWGDCCLGVVIDLAETGRK